MTLVQYEASWQIRLTLKGSGFRIGSEGQIAQLVEHSPEKAGVAGSSPALSILLKSLHSGPLWLIRKKCFSVPESQNMCQLTHIVVHKICC